MITYQFTRSETQLDPTTNDVFKIVVGLTGEEGVNSSYIDLVVDVPPKADYTTNEIRTIALKTALDNDWYNTIKTAIETQKGQPIQGTKFVI